MMDPTCKTLYPHELMIRILAVMGFEDCILIRNITFYFYKSGRIHGYFFACFGKIWFEY